MSPSLHNILVQHAESLGFELEDMGVYFNGDAEYGLFIAGCHYDNKKAILGMICKSDPTLQTRDYTIITTIQAGRLFIDSWNFKNIQAKQSK